MSVLGLMEAAPPIDDATRRAFDLEAVALLQQRLAAAEARVEEAPPQRREDFERAAGMVRERYAEALARAVQQTPAGSA